MKAKYFLLLIILVFVCQCTSKKVDNTETQNKIGNDSCCVKDKARSNSQTAQSEITCPKCGHKKTETMPEDVCVIKYTCENCKTLMFPKEGDCCVFCTYGTHKCPSKQ